MHVKFSFYGIVIKNFALRLYELLQQPSLNFISIFQKISFDKSQFIPDEGHSGCKKVHPGLAINMTITLSKSWEIIHT